MPDKKEMRTFLIGSLLIYFIFVTFLYVSQRKMIYFPNPQRQDRGDYNAADMNIIEALTEDGLKLQGWYKAPQGDKPVIVVFHGNASHMGMSAWKVRPYLDQGYGALLPAYRGYAGNPGKPTEQGLYKDARAFLNWLANEKGFPQSKTVLLGESLGSGVAVEMAATDFKDVRAVILESPYTSFSALAQKHYPFIPFAGYLVRDRYDSLGKIKTVKAPLLIIHGKQDVVVPFALGQQLFDAANEPKKMLVIPLAGHNDLHLHDTATKTFLFLTNL